MKKTLLIVLYAIILALTFVAFAPFFVVTFFVPLIAVCATFRFRTGIFAAVCAAAVSVIYTYSFGGGHTVAAAFQMAPWVAIIPRLIAGAAAWWAGRGARKLFGGRKNRFVSKVLPVSVVATTASLLNTVLVVGSIILLVPQALNETPGAFVVSILGFAVIELIVNNVICPPLSLAIRRGLKGTGLEKEIVPLCDMAAAKE